MGFYMIRFLISLCVTWSVSSWILAETLFFFPSLEMVVSTAERWLTIPRHDEWDMSRVEKERIALQNATSHHLSEVVREEISPRNVTGSRKTGEFQLFFVELPFTIQSRGFESFRSQSGQFWWS